MTFEELVAKSIECAATAEEQMGVAVAAMELEGESRWEAIGVAQAHAGIAATLAEAYARLASAVVVNRASMHAVIDTPAPKRGPVS